MKIPTKILLRLMTLPFLFAASTQAMASAACPSESVPVVASSLHLRQKIFDFCPTVDDVSFGSGTGSKLYAGTWWGTPAPSSDFRNSNGHLQMSLGASVAGVAPKTMMPGELPLLSGAQPFYIEFDYSISDANADHFPAVWLLPIEHDAKQRDVYPGAPAHYEHWQEIDVDEGGYAPGPMGTALAWSGIYPNYQRVRSNPDLHNQAIDRTVRHRYAAAYNPAALTISYYYDDKLQYVARAPAVDTIARQQNFYPIMSVQTQGHNVAYTMDIFRVRAYTAE